MFPSKVFQIDKRTFWIIKYLRILKEIEIILIQRERSLYVDLIELNMSELIRKYWSQMYHIQVTHTLNSVTCWRGAEPEWIFSVTPIDVQEGGNKGVYDLQTLKPLILPTLKVKKYINLPLKFLILTP